MNTKISVELSETYEAVISYLFHQMPLSEMDIESVIAEDDMVYGTTVEEYIFGIDDFKRVMIMQAEEMKGLDPRFEHIPVYQHLSVDEMTGIFIEEMLLTVKTGEAATQRIRAKAMEMKKSEDIQQVLGRIKKEMDAFNMGNISTWLFIFEKEHTVIHWQLADYRRFFEGGYLEKTLQGFETLGGLEDRNPAGGYWKYMSRQGLSIGRNDDTKRQPLCR